MPQTPYPQIQHNKQKTYLIMGLFVLIVSGFFYLLGEYFQTSPVAYFFMGFAFSAVSAVGSYYFSDKIVLGTLGAEPATKEQYFDYYTVTENLCIAAGLPLPRLYVIRSDAPNAFATGRNPENAVICVTTGLLRKLDRAELEGVIAHELSHVRNYDMLVSTIAVTLVGSVVFIADIIGRSMIFRSSRTREESRSPIISILFLLSLIITPLIATLLQLAVSRKREYLADASGALLTRYPEGLARALEKIASDRTPLSSVSSSTAHMFIVSPLAAHAGSRVSSLFSTHPPVEDRIRILRQM